MNKRPGQLVSMALLGLVGVTCIVLASCGPNPDRPPDRDFSPSELLLSEDALPGWDFHGPVVSHHHTCTLECYRMGFLRTVGEDRFVVSEDVYYQKSFARASELVKDPALARGQAPTDWVEPITSADESRYSCTDDLIGRPGISSCIWIGRYQEFVLRISADIGPGAISINEFLTLVELADSKVVARLNGTPTP